MIKELPQKRIWMKSFSTPEEHYAFLQDYQDSRMFDLRYRGLLEFYGADLISYMRDQVNGFSRSTRKSRLDFLQILGHYFTDHLEDECPGSWQGCDTSFWEEFLFAYYPYQMKLGEGAKVDVFLRQLTAFIKWLDARKDTCWHPLVKSLACEGRNSLKACSRLLDKLLLIHFPRIHCHDWDYAEDLNKIEENQKKCEDVVHSVFQVTHKEGNVIEVKDLDLQKSYCIQGLPQKFVWQGMLLDGILGRKKGERLWEWCYTENIYPERAKNYIQFVD